MELSLLEIYHLLSLSDCMVIKTWGDKEVAVISGKGRILGEVSRIKEDPTRDNW